MRILLIILLFPFAISAQTLNRGTNFINIATYASGDGVTDATSGVQAAFNQLGNGKNIIYAPAGTYVISSTVSATKSNFEWVLDPGAKFKFTGAGTRMFSFKGQNITIRGGQFEGTWDTTQYMSETGGKVAGQTLVAFWAENTSNIQNIILDNVKFSLSGQNGLSFANSKNTTMSDITIRNCRFENNWQHLIISNSIDSVAGVLAYGKLYRVRVENNYFRKTAAPPAGIFDSWNYGGNAISLYGYYEHAVFHNNEVYQCGRMALEVFAGAHLDTEIYPKKLWVTNNKLFKSRNRTFSIVAEDAWVENNYIQDSATFHEVGGYNHTYINNTFIGGLGVYIGRNGYPTKVGHTIGTVQYKFIGNTFKGMLKGASAIWGVYTKDVKFSSNQIIYDSTSIDGSHDKKSAITFSSSHNVDISDNVIRFRNTNIVKSLFTLSSNQLVKFRNNQFIIDSTATLDTAIYTDASLGIIQNNNRSEISGNSIEIPFKVFMWDGVIYPIAPQLTVLKRYVWSGSSWTVTDLLSTGLLNDPPASPATNATYLTGDSPTGAWAGKPRQLATWSGSAWTYVVPKDIIWEVTNNAFAISNLPKTAATNDTYVSASGMIDNVFRDNQWDKNRNVTTEASDGIYTIWSTNSQGITYNNLWQNEAKPKIPRGRIWYDKYVPYLVDYRNSTSDVISSATSSETVVQPSDANYTITSGTGNITVIYYNALTADRTVTLPDPATNTGRIITITHGGSGLFNLNLSAAVWKNSSTSFTTISPDQSISIISDGSKYILRR